MQMHTHMHTHVHTHMLTHTHMRQALPPLLEIARSSASVGARAKVLYTNHTGYLAKALCSMIPTLLIAILLLHVVARALCTLVLAPLSSHARTQALYAAAALLRNCPEGQWELQRLDGLSSLLAALESGAPSLARKVLVRCMVRCTVRCTVPCTVACTMPCTLPCGARCIAGAAGRLSP